MKSSLVFSCVIGAALLSTAGCGADAESPDADLGSGVAAAGELRLEARSSAWSETLPAGTSGVVMGAEVAVQCQYTIGTAMQIPPLPPQYFAFVRRTRGSDGPGWCKEGYLVIGTSAQGGVQVDLVRHPFVPILVADYTFKYTPSGEAHSHLAIVQISPRYGEIVRHAGLSAYGPEPWEGNVYSGWLALDAAGTLTVTGDKNGILPGEVGSGDHYTAVWDGFVFSTADNPPPTSIIAY